MSTTDTRAAFEAAVCNIVPRPLFLLNADGSYQEIMVQGFYSLWNAAIAHASNTPKEVSGQGCALCGNGIGHDLECKNHPANAATEAAKATGTVELPPPDYMAGTKGMLCEDAWAHETVEAYGQACAEAARQPAPVVDHLKLICAGFGWRTDGDSNVLADRIEHHIRDLKAGIKARDTVIAERDAALAATAAPVLSDEQILQIAGAEAIDNVTDERRPDNSTIICFARAILAATNRSQP